MHDVGLGRGEWRIIAAEREDRGFRPCFQRVVASATCKEIPLSRRNKMVIAVTSEKGVGSLAAEARIISASAKQQVIAPVARHAVIAGTAIDPIDTPAAGQDVIAFPALDPVEGGFECLLDHVRAGGC